jgi:hypothetical protein
VDLRYGGSDEQQPGEIIYDKSASAISGDPYISCFLLLDDAADELRLSPGLGAGRVITRLGETQLGMKAAYCFVSAFWFLVGATTFSYSASTASSIIRRVSALIGNAMSR